MKSDDKPTEEANDENVTMSQIFDKKRSDAPPEFEDKREAFVHYYEETYGNVSASCELVGINRRTFYRWMKGTSPTDTDFQEKIKLALPDEKLVDYAEAQLLGKLRAGDITAILFTLKTKGKNRGWIERAEKDAKTKITLNNADVLETTAYNIVRSVKAYPGVQIDQIIKMSAEEYRLDAAALRSKVYEMMDVQTSETVN